MDDSIDLQMPQTPQMPQIQMQAKYTHLEKKNSLLDHKKNLKHTHFNNYSVIHGKILISLQKYTQI